MRKYKVHKFEIYHTYAHSGDVEFFKNMYLEKKWLNVY